MPAGSFTLSGKVRTDAPVEGIAILSVKGLDAQWKPTFEEKIYVIDRGVARGQWVPFSKEVVVPDGIKRLEIILTVVEGSGSFWLDDLKLDDSTFTAQTVSTAAAPSQPSATGSADASASGSGASQQTGLPSQVELSNGNMSEGEGTVRDWGQMWQAKGAAATAPASHHRDTEIYLSEPASLRFDVPPGGKPAAIRTQLANEKDGLPAGEFTLSGIARTDAPGEGIAILAVKGLDAQWKPTFEERVLVIDRAVPRGEWVPFSQKVVIPAGMKRLEVILTVVEGSGSFWMDDLKLEDSTFTASASPSNPSNPAAAAARVQFPLTAFDDKVAVGKTPEQLGWSDSVWQPATNAIRIQEVEGRPVLEADVDARTELVFRNETPLEAGKVYRINMLARVVGQVEAIELLTRKRINPFTKHGSDSFEPRREWTEYSTQFKSENSDDRVISIIDLKGMGTFQLASMQIEELDGFDVPVASGEPRGELLVNGKFGLGDYGWAYDLPSHGDDRERYWGASPEARPGIVPHNGGFAFDFKEKFFGFLTATEMLELRYGQTYKLRVEGEAADGDLFAWIGIPSQQLSIHKKIPLRFKDGVAEAEYHHQPPNVGTLSERPQQYYLRVEHFGKTPAQVSAISFTEGETDPAARPQAGVKIRGMADPLRATAYPDEELRADIRATDLPAGSEGVLLLRDARGETVKEVPFQLKQGDEYLLAEVQLPTLPLSWYETVLQVDGKEISQYRDQFAVVERPSADQAPGGFTGVHLLSVDPRQAPHMAGLGIRSARCFEFNWSQIEGEPGEFNFPQKKFDSYIAAGIDPLMILNGTPRWISSAPEAIRTKPGRGSRWWTYPPTELGPWRAFIRKMVAHTGDQVKDFQIWNEPNDYFLKVAPDSSTTVEDAYVELAKAADEVISAMDVDPKLVVGETAGQAREFFEKTANLGLFDYGNVLSYHAYGESQSGSQGASAFAPAVAFYRELMKTKGKDLPIWDTESGFNVPAGGAGYTDSLQLLKGMIARKAAGISRYYIYSGNPRDFPGQKNFHMILGFDNRPLVTAPMIAYFNKLVANAALENDRSDPEKGLQLYEFRSEKGERILAGWLNADTEESVDVEGFTASQGYDSFGNALAETDGTIRLNPTVRYFVEKK